jgi:hypothetical protein
VAIPTFQRATNIAVSGTLNFLRQANYPPELIYLFVASEDEKRLYEHLVPRHLYYNIIVGVLGLSEQRNFITDYFPEDEILLQMDDDVKGIKTQPRMSFIDLVLKGINVVETTCGLWGILPIDDGRRMEEKTTIHLTHIIGSFFINKNHKEVRITTTEKEDFERSILYFQLYGCVARYKGAGVNTKFEGNEGGLQADGRRERMATAIRYMAEKYPTYVTSVMKRKGADIMLNWRAI